MMNRSRGYGMYVSCHSEYKKPDMTQTHAVSAPVISRAIIGDYTLILLGLRLLRRCVFIGMLTGRNNYSTIDAVITRVYGLVLRTFIMGRVSI